MDLFELSAKLVLDTSEFMAGVQDGIKESGVLKNALLQIGTAAVKGVQNLAASGDKIAKSAARLKISTDAYQKLGYAIEMSGGNVDNLYNAMQNIFKYIDGNASKKATDALWNLGFSPDQLEGMGSADEMIESVINNLANIKDTAVQADIGEAIFGKSAFGNLSAFFAEGEAGIAQLKAQAEELGLVRSQEEIDAAVKANDAMANLEKALTALMNNALTPLLPAVTSVADALTPAIVALEPVIQAAADALTEIIHTVLRILGLDDTPESGMPSKGAQEQAGASFWDLYDMFSGAGDQNGYNSVVSALMQSGMSPETAARIAGQIHESKYGTNMAGESVSDDFGESSLAVVEAMTALAAAIDEMNASTDGAGEALTGVSESATTAQEALDSQTDAADSAKESLDNQAEAADSAKESLDKQAEAADTAKEALDSQAEAADSSTESLGEQASAADAAQTALQNQASSADSAASSSTALSSALLGASSAAFSAAQRFNSIHLNPNGSHAAGLNYVPYDGYRAELHRGEQVLTASQARQGAGGGFDLGALARTVADAVREGMKNAQVNAYMDGKEVTDNVSRRMANEFKAMRYAT